MQPDRERRSQIQGAAGDEGAAVDHARIDAALAEADRKASAAWQRWVSDADRSRLEHAAAGEPVAVQPRPVPRGDDEPTGGSVRQHEHRSDDGQRSDT